MLVIVPVVICPGFSIFSQTVPGLVALIAHTAFLWNELEKRKQRAFGRIYRVVLEKFGRAKLLGWTMF